MTPRPLVFFDIETSGLKPESEIIQLSAIAVELPSWREIGVPFNKKLMFNESLAEPKALEINHYDPHAWAREAEPTSVVLQGFAYWLKNYPAIQMTSKAGRPYWLSQLAGYNSEGFDAERVRKAFSTFGIFYPAHYRTLDVLQLAAWDTLGYDQGDGPKSLKLTDMCEWLRIPTEGAHDALADVRMTIQVAKRLCFPFNY